MLTYFCLTHSIIRFDEIGQFHVTLMSFMSFMSISCRFRFFWHKWHESDKKLTWIFSTKTYLIIRTTLTGRPNIQLSLLIRVFAETKKQQTWFMNQFLCWIFCQISVWRLRNFLFCNIENHVYLFIKYILPRKLLTARKTENMDRNKI